MPRIVRAEFLSYYNSARNSDKLFNVFVLEDEDGNFSCIAERGRRGTRLVRDTLCTGEERYVAETEMRRKIFAKRNHRDTPYTNEPFGANYSQIVGEYGYNNQTTQTANENLTVETRQSAPKNTSAIKANVIAFPVEKKQKVKNKPQPSGILNQGQFDSLEI